MIRSFKEYLEGNTNFKKIPLKIRKYNYNMCAVRFDYSKDWKKGDKNEKRNK